MNETTVTVVGNLISDPTVRRTSEENRVVHFRMASTERRFDREAQQWTDGESFYVNVTCWRRLANGVAVSLAKGDPVIATGRLSTRSYELDGQRRYSVELVAQALGPDLARCTAEVSRTRREPIGSGDAKPESRQAPVTAAADGPNATAPPDSGAVGADAVAA